MDSGLTQVQHVNKKSSDELLRKFAEDSGDDRQMEIKKSMKLTKRRKSSKNSGEHECRDNNETGGGARIRLLAPAAARRSLLLRHLGVGRSHHKNKSLVRTIGKTWRKTVEGASRMFIEKHYNRHRRLINDVI